MFNVAPESTSPVLPGEELIARHEGARKLRIVGRQELLGIVECVAGEELAAAPVP